MFHFQPAERPQQKEGQTAAAPSDDDRLRQARRQERRNYRKLFDFSFKIKDFGLTLRWEPVPNAFFCVIEPACAQVSLVQQLNIENNYTCTKWFKKRDQFSKASEQHLLMESYEG